MTQLLHHLLLCPPPATVTLPNSWLCRNVFDATGRQVVRPFLVWKASSMDDFSTP